MSLAGAEVISEELDDKHEDTKPVQLGRARRVTVDNDNTTIGGAGDRAAINARTQQIRPMFARGQRGSVGPIPTGTSCEQDLVNRMRSGEQRAFDQFFAAYAPRVRAFATSRVTLDAAALDDAVQVTMIRAIRGLHGFRGDSALFSWLCQICRNHLADLGSKARRQPPEQSFEQIGATQTADTPTELTGFRDPLDECVTDLTRRAVRRTVNRLPSSYAHILELRFCDELIVAEIAQILRISHGAAQSRLARARQAFRDCWNFDDSTASAA